MVCHGPQIEAQPKFSIDRLHRIVFFFIARSGHLQLEPHPKDQ